jgi:hypothetical protein
VQVDVAAANKQLELLDVGSDSLCSPWGGELPVRLQQMHSHWVCRSVGMPVIKYKVAQLF